RVAAFARAHAVDIDFEVVDDELVAVRFAVTFGGCCGYEGADALARYLNRPRTQRCCSCPPDWFNDWSVALEGGIQLRSRVRVNRVEVRWERTVTVADLIDRADSAIGKPRAHVRESAGDRWTDLDLGRRALLEAPYPFERSNDRSEPATLDGRDDLGLQVAIEHGRISELSFALHDFDGDARHELSKILRAKWGRPRVISSEPRTLAWRAPGRSITAELEGFQTKIVIRARGGTQRGRFVITTYSPAARDAGEHQQARLRLSKPQRAAP
ncbi:MAG: hypothetical protein H7138_27735, partial [Myxococcales bacterium]|nr:hypothetical protein [Myxococcales bacterium]